MVHKWLMASLLANKHGLDRIVKIGMPCIDHTVFQMEFLNVENGFAQIPNNSYLKQWL